ncbi:MAG: hypothetical protein KBT11_08025 [Treponema sp.]|nr:hypothetical protein [Candidatus Treponema equifaecale]
MKKIITVLTASLLVAASSVFMSCGEGTGSENLTPEAVVPKGDETQTLTQEQMISKLNDNSKEIIFEAVLASKNAEALLVKLSDRQKAELFDLMYTVDKQNEAFEAILASKRAEGKVIELLNDKEKADVFDELLAAKTSKDFIVEILTQPDKQTLYDEIKTYFKENFTQAELIALLDDESKNSIYDSILASQNADALLAKLSFRQKVELFDLMYNDEKKNEAFEAILREKRAEDKVIELLNDKEKTDIFDELLKIKTSKDFILEILTKPENETLFYEVRSYFTETYTQAELLLLLNDESKTTVFEQILSSKNADALLEELSDAQKVTLLDKMLASDEKNSIFEAILAEKRDEGKVAELLNDAEKIEIFDTLLAIKTSKDFIVGLLEENESLYTEVKDYFTEKFTQAELIALLNGESKTSVYEEVLASQNADALLAKLSDEQKTAVFDKMLTADKKNTVLEAILEEKRKEGKVAELLNDEEKSAIFDTLLVTKTSRAFIVEILTKEGNEAVYADVKKYITDTLSKEELVALLNAKDSTPPAVVSTLAATSKDTGIELTWTDPNDEDLWGFVIGYYENTSARALSLDNTKHEFVVGKSSNTDRSNSTFVGNLTDKKSYTFYIKSIDENFNVSDAKESTSCTYNEKFVEVPVNVTGTTATVSKIKYFKQTLPVNGNYTYELDSQEDKNLEAGTVLSDITKTITGFSKKGMSENDGILSVYFDRNVITYTFNSGENGTFADGTTTKELKGLYGSSATIPIVKSTSHNFGGWFTSTNITPATTYGESDLTFTVKWNEKLAGGFNWYETPIDVETNEVATASSKYIYFGVFPKTVLSEISGITVDETEMKVMGANTYYKGNDGNYYSKVRENAYGSSYTYTDGTTAKQSTANSTRYFKVEPIKWKVLTTNYNNTGKALLLCEDILTGNVPYHVSWSDRTIGGSTVYANNYKYSTIRAYLNGKYESDDTQSKTAYADKGFLQTAFTSTAQLLIAETVVDNSKETTGYSESTYAATYACENTTDKIFLLSESEVINSSYGFAVYNRIGQGSARIRITTDYAKANYAYQRPENGYGGYWWLRSPSYNFRNIACYVNYDGNASNNFLDANLATYGVVPALSISLQ